VDSARNLGNILRAAVWPRLSNHWMKISIVVPAFNEEKLLGQSLAAIHSSASVFTDRGWDWEVVVCDNNSTDRTAEIARNAGATVIFEPINQISRARNAGAAAASGEWIVFIDADSFPSARLFEKLAERIDSGRVIGGGCLMRMDEWRPLLAIAVNLWNVISLLNSWAAGAFVYCRADAFREVGGFSEQMYVSEEVDLSKRLKQLGRRRGLRMKIITEERMVTSSRKIHLYGVMGHLRFLKQLILAPRRTVQTREDCVLWYDGRR
jgi:glycosyltransferase involved in cell wall biosynthesis